MEYLSIYLEIFLPMMLIGIATGIIFFKVKESYLIASLASSVVMLLLIDLSQYRVRFTMSGEPFLLFGFALLAISVVIVNIVTPYLKTKEVETLKVEQPKKNCCKSIRAKNKFNSRSLKRGR